MSQRKTQSRRRFLSNAGILGLAAVPFLKHARAATPLRPVSMQLDWLMNGPNVGFLVAREKGFYEQAGLNVTITAGKGSGSTAQLVASNVTQFGFSDGYVVANGVANGMSLLMVAAIFRRNPTTVVVLADSPIKTPKDLEGKTLGMNTGGTHFQQWPAYALGCGIDVSKVRVVNVDPAGTPPALIAGRVDAVAGYGQGTAPAIEVRGNKPTRMLWFTDCGVTAVSNGIIAQPAFVKANPALVRDFVAASIKGFLYARQNLEEAVAINKKFNEALSEAIVRREAQLSWESWVTPNTAGRPLGWMSDKDWDATVNVLRKYGSPKGPVDARQLYTNDFIPSSAEFIPPQP
jgi:NitT/TauT family transport system substrate-binding protein